MKCNTCGEMNCMSHGGMPFAEGGEVDHDKDADDELSGAVCDEFWDASDRKDKKGMLDAIKALVLSYKE